MDMNLILASIGVFLGIILLLVVILLVAKQYLTPVSYTHLVAHRRELVDQIEETVSRHGMSKEDGRVRVMSIQWLSRNRQHMDEEPDLIVIDEAHHALSLIHI